MIVLTINQISNIVDLLRIIFARGRHTSVAHLPLRQLGFLVFLVVAYSKNSLMYLVDQNNIKRPAFQPMMCLLGVSTTTDEI